MKQLSRQASTHFAVTAGLMILCLAIPAMARNTRSWVSHEGKDLNDCTIGHPCRTFQRAHNATQIDGEVDVLDPGDYGTLVIDHAITIDGGNMAYIGPTLNPVVDAIVVKQSASPRVVLRNLSIRGATGAAINWLGTGHLNIHGVTILGSDVGIHVSPLNATPGSTSERSLYVEDTTMVEVARVGVFVQTATDPNSLPPIPLDMTILRTSIVIRHDGFGIAGIQFGAGKAQVVQCMISGYQEGLFVPGAAELNLEDSTIAYSSFAAVEVGDGVVHIASNNIHDNAAAFFTVIGLSGQIISFGNNRVAGNASSENPTSTVSLK